MGRVVKFRAWDKVEKRWRKVENIFPDPEFGGVTVPGKSCLADWETGERECEHIFLDWDKVELVWGTGLHDRHGNELYEGDHIRFDYSEDLHTGSFTGVVEWDDRGLWSVMISDHGFSTDLCSEKISGIEIVGNRYEHPHLLTPEPRDG